MHDLSRCLSVVGSLILISPPSLTQFSSDDGWAAMRPLVATSWAVGPDHVDPDSARAGDGSARGWSAARPDGHAPIGVMGDHTHSRGEWMFSVRAMRMHMEGMRNNTDRLSNGDVFAQGFLATPTKMDMDMLMFGGMYAPTDHLTLTAMVPYLSNSMDHATRNGGRFSTSSDGLGDIALGGLYKVADSGGHRVHLNASVSIPTGSIDERGAIPNNSNAKLPYPMQLGTGTVDLLPGLTWLLERGDWSFGAQGIYRIHLGTNSDDYSRGDRLNATVWSARRLGSVSLSLRLNAAHWENIDGADPELPPPSATVVPTARPDMQGGDRVDVLVGINSHARRGALAGHRLAAEFGLPAFQDLDGPQLETDWILILGWQYSF